jgi:hypothetical protein
MGQSRLLNMPVVMTGIFALVFVGVWMFNLRCPTTLNAISTVPDLTVSPKQEVTSPVVMFSSPVFEDGFDPLLVMLCPDGGLWSGEGHPISDDELDDTIRTGTCDQRLGIIVCLQVESNTSTKILQQTIKTIVEAAVKKERLKVYIRKE